MDEDKRENIHLLINETYTLVKTIDDPEVLRNILCILNDFERNNDVSRNHPTSIIPIAALSYSVRYNA